MFWGYPPPPNDYPYHWVILDPKSKEDKVKVTNLKNSPKFQKLLKLLDKMCKYEMDLMSIIEDTERTRFCPQTDRRTDGQTDKVIPVYPPFNFVEAGGIIIHHLFIHKHSMLDYWLMCPYPCQSLSLVCALTMTLSSSLKDWCWWACGPQQEVVNSLLHNGLQHLSTGSPTGILKCVKLVHWKKHAVNCFYTKNTDHMDFIQPRSA